MSRTLETPSRPCDGAGDALVLVGVLQRDPDRLRHVLGGDRRVVAGEQLVAVELPDLVERLLAGLEVVVRDLGVVLDDRGDLGLLRVGDLVGADRAAVVDAAQVDRDLELVAPVVGGLGGLLVEQHADADEGQRDEEGQHHGEVHRQVAAQALAELGEDVAKLHGGEALDLLRRRSGGDRGAVSSGGRRRPAPGRARRGRSRAR